jgi:hypothetical protein
MQTKQVLKYLIEQEVRKYLREGEDTTTPGPLKPARSFEEDPVQFILSKYPSLRETLAMLLTNDYADYITGVYVIAPKPTTFKIVLHNGQSFYLRYLGRSYEAKVEAKRYYLLTLGERQRATLAIAHLLELGAPINVKGPETELAHNETPAEAGGGAPAPPSGEPEPPTPEVSPNQAEEEKTES